MERRTWLYIVDAGLAITFLGSAATGIIKFPALTQHFLWVYRAVPGYYITKVHDWSGIIMAALVLVHLALNWEWMVSTTRGFFKK